MQLYRRKGGYYPLRSAERLSFGKQIEGGLKSYLLVLGKALSALADLDQAMGKRDQVAWTDAMRVAPEFLNIPGFQRYYKEARMGTEARAK